MTPTPENVKNAYGTYRGVLRRFGRVWTAGGGRRRPPRFLLDFDTGIAVLPRSADVPMISSPAVRGVD
jgi:hypothetical protein